MTIMANNDDFGECGLQDCGDCAAMPSCPAARQKKSKMRYRKVRAYRIVKVGKGRVAIIPAGMVKCKTGSPIKRVKPKTPASW